MIFWRTSFADECRMWSQSSVFRGGWRKQWSYPSIINIIGLLVCLSAEHVPCIVKYVARKRQKSLDSMLSQTCGLQDWVAQAPACVVFQAGTRWDGIIWRYLRWFWTLKSDGMGEGLHVCKEAGTGISFVGLLNARSNEFPGSRLSMCD